MDAAIEQLFEKIIPLKASDFYKTRCLTPEQEGWLQSICDRYITDSPERQRSIETLVTPKIAFLFGMYGTAMAVQAVRAKDEEKIFKGLIAMAIENQIPDWRDSMYVLALLRHSAIKIGANPSILFQRAAEMASTRSAKFFRAFLARTPENCDIRIFRMKEGVDSEGNFIYVAEPKVWRREIMPGKTEWYFGVYCVSCGLPILVGIDRSEGKVQFAAPGAIRLTCPKSICRQQHDYPAADFKSWQLGPGYRRSGYREESV